MAYYLSSNCQDTATVAASEDRASAEGAQSHFQFSKTRVLSTHLPLDTTVQSSPLEKSKIIREHIIKDPFLR